MSEASRIEQAIASAEGEDIDLGAMLRQCADSYRDLVAPRQLRLSLPTRPLNLHCSPELLAASVPPAAGSA